MKGQLMSLGIFFCLSFGLLCHIASAQNPPSGFASVTVSSQWNEAVGLAFSKDGQDMFVWERGGKVWVVRNSQRTLLLDITEEVGGWHDHGLLGFALHPNFDQNGQFYVLYLVDRHYLKNFGTGSYNPSANEFFDATIGRLTRYTASKNGNGYTIVGGSRKILLGETISTGIPVLSITHSTGTIVFGTDNTLLVATGDGASPAVHDSGNASSSYYVKGLAEGIIRPAENVGAFRSQLLDGYNGKILRIDPETGAGISSNPFYDPAKPNSAKSKVWALGFRNPFRMSFKPNTGSHNPDDGNPGILYVGDVGWNLWEEINVVDRPGQNFGWPIYEGHLANDNSNVYASILTPNMDAPNPQFGVNGCTQQYFNFQDLIKQETLSGAATFLNSCGGQTIPSNITTYVHSRPLLAWRHCCEPARVATFNGQTPTTSQVLPGASPVPGPDFVGQSSTGGLFYTGADFAGFQNSYFFGDYAAGWIRNITVDGNDNPTSVRNFVDQNVTPVAFAMHPSEEGLYYVNFPDEIRKITFSNNRPPIAVATADQTFGGGPLTVQFKGDASTDFENQPLNYSWNFGDGSGVSTSANPSHTFNAPPDVPTPYTVTLTVTDNQGATNQTSINISVNNTPPQVTITSPINNDKYPLTGETTYTLRAEVSDSEHNSSQLTYRWQTILHHEVHEHPSPPDNAIETTTLISPLGCDGEEYYYRIVLTVTDAAGAATTREVRLYPDCGSSGQVTPTINWPQPASIVVGTPLSVTQLNATANYNGNSVPGTFTYTPPLGTVLAVGNNQQLQVNFTPNDAILYNTATKTVSINVLSNTSNFYRAINLNGPALTIDGNNWEASASAGGFSFSNGQPFANQGVTLVPSTDANRASMIRSCIYGPNLGIALGNVPVGNYQVYLYVWEDNSPEVFNVSLEGSVVQANFNSGTAGSWTKLGPYQVNLTDGTINVNVNGGYANVSGLEVWTAGSQQPTGPTIVNPIPDQVATVGMVYNYTFPSNTFSGTGINYAATLMDGNILPAWLGFNATTRTFSGTPGAGNTGTIGIRVTAANGGGSANDVFNLTVNAAGATTFYRAINLNGPALSIDSRNWEASASSAGFSFTNGATFSNQGVTLVPATDANRATMIRSSIYGNNLGIALANVPAGNYEIYLYVWEDNNPEVFNVSLEGSVVRASFNSGSAGSWTKLGPYQASIADGTINVNVNGGYANLSGLEVWSLGSQQPIPPAVVNPIPDQVATVGIGYNYTFPANTFSGTGLSYVAALSDGNALPAWLGFNATTRTFSGTPGAGNTGTISVRVTASNSAGPANDVFNITVNAAGSTAFYRAINVNGVALTIDGNNWEASASAAGFSYTNGTPFANQGVTLVPATDANRASMIRSFIYGPNLGIALANVPAGNYQVYVYVWEDNNPEVFNVSLEGSVVRASFNSGTAGSWTKLGPYPLNLTDGTINVTVNGGYANISGLEVWSTGSQQPVPPAVANPVPDQVATVGVAYNYTFPANTFTGTGLSYVAALSDGSALPAWLGFNATTRTFSGTPGAGNTGTIGIRVTAANGGGSANDVFNLTVNAAGATTFYRAINLNGPALSIDSRNWEASASAAGFSFTNGATFSNQGVTLVPATDANRATMIRSSIYGNNLGIALANVPAGNYEIYLYVWEDNNPEVFNVSLEGSVVRANFNSGSAGSWTKLGPYQASIADGIINVNVNGGFANLSGLEVWSLGSQQPIPPVVVNPIPDQVATVGVVYNYTFPANTFSGTGLSYVAALSDGSALPAWLGFNATTRTFSGTPGAGNTGTISARVTASNSAGPANDVFNITVNAAGSTAFYRAINVNGSALTIDGNNWEASASAPGFSFTNGTPFANQGVTLVPATDANRASMIRSSIYGPNLGIALANVPAGSYQVYVYVWEDNNAEVFNVSLEGVVVRASFNSGTAGSWTKLGPYPLNLTDGTINVNVSGGGYANLSGLEVWSVPAQSQGGAREAIATIRTASVAEQNAVTEFVDLTAYPNPFSDKVTVVFTTRQTGPTRLVMLDAHGAQARTVYSQTATAGTTVKLEVESGTLPNSVYLLQLINGSYVRQLRVTIMK
ncbi:MAG: putative Ig domain-containing protein [Chryseolinea sp.]